MKKVAIFASGTGSNFEAIVKAVQSGKLNAKIALLVCDKPDALVISKAKSKGIESFVFSAKDFSGKEAYETEILSQLRKKEVELIALAGYMRIVGKTLLDAYPNQIVNIHPSLLPHFPGKDAIKQAYDAGVKETGVSVHYVDAGIDTGPIISQEKVEIKEADTLESLEKKVHQVEHVLYVVTLKNLLEG